MGRFEGLDEITYDDIIVGYKIPMRVREASSEELQAIKLLTKLGYIIDNTLVPKELEDVSKPRIPITWMEAKNLPSR